MSDNDLENRAQGRLGTVLGGKYRLDSVLGVGGMAVVFAATHRNQKRVAIKMLHSELSVNEQLRTRFLREGYAANTVDHVGAVAVLDDDTAEDGAAFLVMERLEGEEVDRFWERSGSHLAPDLVLALAAQLLDVLAAAHTKAIIHRDIKPSNLYITRDGTLKVLDFGIARVRDVASTGPSATGTGIMLGTPAFMAPEQALGKSKQIDGTTDVWSVGATMFSLLSGCYVHEGESATEMVVLVATQPARSLATVAPHIDPRIVRLVDRALAFQKTDRWPSANAMRDAVHDTYLEVFGTKLTREPLERIFTDAPLDMAATAHAFSAPPPAPVAAPSATPAPIATPPTSPPPAYPSTAPMPARPFAFVTPARTSGAPPGRASALPPTREMTAIAPPVTPVPNAPWQSVGGRALNLSANTAQPVSSEAYRTPAGVPNKRANMFLLVGLAAVGLGLGGGIAWMIASGSKTSTSAASSASAGETVAPLAASAPRPAYSVPASPPPASTPFATVAPVTAPRGQVPPLQPSTPTEEATRYAVPQASAAPPPAAAPASPARPASPAAQGQDFFHRVFPPARSLTPAPATPSPQAPAAGKPAYCATNPTTVDRQGLRIPRPECE